ncbi:MAG: hypothetical protein ACFFD1_16140 [Candidatus Thorarchaeota archaeon]
MTNQQIDSSSVVIIGGNISGLSCALELGKKGISTDLYETHIWDKPCGGGFGIHFAQMLKNDFNVDIPFRFVNDLIMATKYKKISVRIPLAIVSRKKLQENLINHLKNKFSSVSIHLGRKVNFTKDFNNVFKKINVVATGVSGFSREALNKQLIDVGKFQYQLIQADSNIENFDATIFYFLPKTKGYAWLFPAPEGKVDIGIGGLTKHVNWDKEFIGFYNWLKKNYDFDIRINKRSRSWGIPIPINKPGKIVHSNQGKLFIGIGDSIELPDASTAAGIECAWNSGKLLGEAIESSNNVDLPKYASNLSKMLKDSNITSSWSRFEARFVRHKVMFPLIFNLVPGKLVKMIYDNPNT